MTFDQIERKTSGIKNLNSVAAARWLHGLIQSIPGIYSDPSLFACEVGTYFGYMSSVFAMSGIRTITIDHMRCGFCDIAPDSRSLYMDVIQNFINAGVWSSIVPIPMKSLDSIELLKVMNPRIGLLYLDGDHNVDTVLKELKAFDQFIVSGGFVCGDDCTIHDNKTSFNICWAKRMVEQFDYIEHDCGAGVSSAVWEFFKDNESYEVIPGVPFNQFGFRKLA